MANAMVVYKGKPERHSWCRWFIGRTRDQNKNNLVSIVGKTGSGKTYSAISICEIISEMSGIPFGIDHVVFSLKELMELINSGELKKGSSIVFDEPQVSISAREFQSKANKVFNYLLSTFRHRNLSLFFCTPFETLLDKNTRMLFHGCFNTISIDRKKRTCKLQARFVEYADFKAEPYRKKLIVFYSDDGKRKTTKVSFWDIPEPSPEMIKLYEAKKLAFTNRLNENISAKLAEFDASGKSMTGSAVAQKKGLTQKQEEVLELLQKNSVEEVAKQLGIGMGSIYEHKKRIEKKGYVLKPIYSENRVIRFENNENG